MVVSTLLSEDSFEYISGKPCVGIGLAPIEITLFGIPIVAGAMLVTLYSIFTPQ